VGPVTSLKLREAGFATVGQIAALDRETLAGVVGTGAGHHLHALAHNRDPRVVDTQRGRRSISAQRALGNRNDRTLPEIQAIVLGLVDRIAQRLRAKDWVTRTVTVRFRFADMVRATRSHTLATPTATTAALHEVADQLTVDLLGAEAPEDGRTELARRGLTLIGVAFSGLGRSDAVQLTLPGTADEPLALQADRRELDSAVDAVRERFGHDLVKSAALLGQSPALEMPRLPD
jgi:DNA polymerase-4